MQLRFHGRTAEVPPQRMRSMDSTENGGRPPSAWCAPRERLDECDQGLPRHDLAHLFREHFLALLLVESVQPSVIWFIPLSSPHFTPMDISREVGFCRPSLVESSAGLKVKLRLKTD